MLRRLTSQNISDNSITLSTITDWMKWLNSVNKDSGEYREVAFQRLISCLKKGMTSLDLSGLALTTLPDTIPNSIESLDVHNNQLISYLIICQII
ncbi:hypothetical protein CBG25_07960 [Arsenophonus sp. ENCA]|nr:hypothetical protein CBG25_07960 [Arsenophonus sp. ENCA]